MISSSVHSIEAARSDRFIGGQLSGQTTAGPTPNVYLKLWCVTRPHKYDQSKCKLLSLTGRRARRHRARQRRLDTASSPDRKKAKLDPFADVRNYTQRRRRAPLSWENKSMSALAVGPLEFWRQKADQLPIMSFTARRFCVCLRARQLGPIRAWLFVGIGRTVTEMRSRLSA